jgi:acetyltransferase-like isoleucine patch superfamily enzyme/acyl carrier protein
VSLRRRIAISDSPFARAARGCRRAVLNFTLPLPRPLLRLMLAVFLALRAVYYFLIRVCVCEPLFKAYCEKYGRGVRTGVYIHWVGGSGKLVVGDDVLVDGKCSFAFAVRYAERPALTIGSHTIVSHGCSFTVGREITIGSHCLIASNVRMYDAPGHPTDPALRKAGNPANPEDVRPICIQDNVWIGTNAVIFPGVTVGEGSVVAIGAVVVNDVPPYTLVGGNPARMIQRLSTGTAFAGTAVAGTAFAATALAKLDDNVGHEPATASATASNFSSRSLEGVLAILRETLGVEVGPTEDFYDAGMTSIMTLPLLLEIEKRFGVAIPEDEFLDARTAQDLAGCIQIALARAHR